ncbi:MAG: NAD-dependent epimerase/dehydratase family protein [Sphingomonadales bacterium]
MIIGNGLLANSLKDIDRNDVVFFCSGVSNSGETAPAAFQRELALLKTQDTHKLLCYFSTVSIFNPSKKNTPYIQHKCSLEAQIQEQFPNHIILRLPNMMGEGGNGSNLFPYFLKNVAEGKIVSIFDNTHRELMEVQLLPDIINALIAANFRGSINAGFGDAPKVKDIYLHICSLLDAEPSMKIEKGEDAYEVDYSVFNTLMEKAGVAPAGSWQDRVERYVNLYRSQFV